ncbi:MAG: hypothetical protein AAGF11_56745 [Myxococcota bacterium]
MLQTRDIDALISTLAAARTGKSHGPEKDHDDRVDEIIAKLQALKDQLSPDADGIDDQYLERQIKRANALYTSPYDFVGPTPSSSKALGLEARDAPGPGALAREHRRQMQANILAAIQAYMDLGERTTKDGSTKFADLLENRDNLTSHFKKVHRHNKVLAQISTWDALHPLDPVQDSERAWLRAKVSGDKGVTAPAKARAKVLGKAIVPKRGVRKVIEDMESARRLLVMIRHAFATDDNRGTGAITERVSGRLNEAHTDVFDAAIRRSTKSRPLTYYNTSGARDDPLNVIGHDPRFTVDYSGQVGAVVGIYLTERTGEGEAIVRRYQSYSVSSGRDFSAVKGDRVSSSDRREFARIVEALVRARLGPSARIGARLPPQAHGEILYWLDDQIADLRQHALVLFDSKINYDNPRRLLKEIGALGKSARHVETQLKVWERQVTFLKDLYVLLLALPPTKASDATRYRRELMSALGPILSNPGFGVKATEDLRALVAAAVGTAPAEPAALGAALIHCSTHKALPARDKHHDLQKSLTTVSLETAEQWWAKAKLMVETELLELSYLTRMARGDLAVRPEVDWTEISKLVEQRIRAANGLICYVEKFEGAYATINTLITWLVGSLNNPDSQIRKDYPSVGDASISISVGLTAGGTLLSFVSLGLSLTVQISGSITQEDDRRLRFKGSFSLGVKASAEADLLAGSDMPSTIDFGDADSEHTAAEFDWLNMKMGVALDKGLASLNGAYVYAGPEQMAAAWAHRVAMFQTYVASAIAWIPMPGLRKHRGARRMQVLDPRTVADEEAKMLELIAGKETGAMLAQLGKPILGTRAWRGPLHARDIGLAFDMQLPIPATTTKIHAENYRQKKIEISFWRHSYASKTHTVDKWAERSTPSSSGPSSGPPAGPPAGPKMSHVIVRNWSKSYPPAVAFSLAASLEQVSTEDGSAGLFNVMPLLDPSKSTTTVASLGFSSDMCPAIDLTFLDIDNHPNPDNDGQYVNIKAGRKSTLSAGTDLMGPSLGFSVAWTKGQAINPREAALVMEKLRGFPADIPFDERLSGARGFVYEHLESGEHMPAMERLAMYGTFELNLVYSGTSRSPRWEIQYGRIWRGIETTLSVGIPVLPGLTVDVGGSLAMNRGRHEILGLETMTYVQTVYDGVTNRQRGAEYWAAFRKFHQAELLSLCANVGRDGEVSPYGHNNAHEEVRDDSQAEPPRSLSPGPEQQAQAAVKAKAKALLEACKEPEYAATLFGGEATEWQAMLAAATPRANRTLQIAREVRNRIRRSSTQALSLRVVNDVTYAQSQVWPDRRDALPSTPAPRFLFVNPLQAHEIHCAVRQAQNAATLELEILDRGGTVVWSRALRPKPVAAPEATETAPPPPAPVDNGVTTAEDLNRDEPVDEARRTPSQRQLPANTPITHVAEVRLEPGQAPLSSLTYAAGPYKVRLKLEPRPGARSRRPATWAYIWAIQPREIETALDEYLAAKKAWAAVCQKSAWGGGSSASALTAVFFEDEQNVEAPELGFADDGDDQSSMLPAVQEQPDEDDAPVDPYTQQKEDIKTFWREQIRPHYLALFPNADLPAQLAIDDRDAFDGDGGPGSVRVFKRVVTETDAAIRLFALCHETGHAVAAQKIRSLPGKTQDDVPQPMGDGAKQHEYFADLIGIHVIQQRLPTQVAGITAAMNTIAQKLGAGDVVHPSGAQRVAKMRRLLAQANTLDALIIDVLDHPPHGN